MGVRTRDLYPVYMGPVKCENHRARADDLGLWFLWPRLHWIILHSYKVGHRVHLLIFGEM